MRQRGKHSGVARPAQAAPRLPPADPEDDQESSRMLERGFLPREAGRLSLARARERLRHGPPAHSERPAGRRRELFEAAAQRRRVRRGDRRRVAQRRRRGMALAAAADRAAVQGRGRARLCSRLRRGVRAGAQALARGAARNGPSDRSRHDAGDLAGAARQRARREPRRGGSAEHRTGRRRVSRLFGVEDRADLARIAAVDPASGLAGHDARGADDARHRHARSGKRAKERGAARRPARQARDGKRPRHGRGHARRSHRRQCRDLSDGGA